MDREKLVNSIQERLKKSDYSSARQLNHPILQQDEYDTLAHHAQKNDVVCCELLFACSGRLVHSFVNNYIHNNDDYVWTYDDLMQSGFLGINYALDNWDEEKGLFTSYSVYYIQREISNQIRTLGNSIIIRDQHRSTLAQRLPYLKDLCELEYGLEVSNETFAKWINKNGYSKDLKVGITAEDIFSMNEIQCSISLDSPILLDSESHETLLDRIIDTQSINPLSQIIQKESLEEKRYLARRLLETLTEKQKLVVELYYEFDNSAICSETGKTTFNSVANVLQDRCQEHWSQMQCILLHTRALKRMRQSISIINSGLNYV